MNCARSRIRGFTMIELMVTLGVMVILLILAVPMINTTLEKNDVSSASNALLADLTYARSEAVDRGTDVSVCPSTDGTSCASSTAYDTGWLVYTYSSSPTPNSAYNSTASNNVLLRYTTAQSGVSIQVEATTNPAFRPISFGPQGEMKPDTDSSAFDICYRAGDSDTGYGQSTSEVPGVLLTVESSGSTSSETIAAGASCSAPAPSSSI